MCVKCAVEVHIVGVLSAVNLYKFVNLWIVPLRPLAESRG